MKSSVYFFSVDEDEDDATDDDDDDDDEEDEEREAFLTAGAGTAAAAVSTGEMAFDDAFLDTLFELDADDDDEEVEDDDDDEEEEDLVFFVAAELLLEERELFFGVDLAAADVAAGGSSSMTRKTCTDDEDESAVGLLGWVTDSFLCAPTLLFAINESTSAAAALPPSILQLAISLRVLSFSPASLRSLSTSSSALLRVFVRRGCMNSGGRFDTSSFISFNRD